MLAHQHKLSVTLDWITSVPSFNTVHRTLSEKKIIGKLKRSNEQVSVALPGFSNQYHYNGTDTRGVADATGPGDATMGAAACEGMDDW